MVSGVCDCVAAKESNQAVTVSAGWKRQCTVTQSVRGRGAVATLLEYLAFVLTVSALGRVHGPTPWPSFVTGDISSGWLHTTLSVMAHTPATNIMTALLVLC